MPKRSGFTLIELLVVITIIALLAAIGIINYQKVSQSGRDAKRQSDVKQIQSGLEQYFADQFFYPTSIITNDPNSSLSNLIGRNDNPAPAPTQKKYLNNVPCDLSTNNCTAGTGTPYCYIALPPTCSNSSVATRCTNYELYALLENPPAGTYSCGSFNTYNLKVIRL